MSNSHDRLNTARINLVEQMVRGMVASGEIAPSQIVIGLHNALAFGKLHIETYGHVNEILLTRAFQEMDALTETLKMMEQ